MFAKRFGWTPEVVGNMTPVQQTMYLHADTFGTDPRTGKPTMKFDTMDEYNEWLAKHAS